MDHGHGLIDRILIATPLAYRPTLSEMETAANDLSTKVVSDFDELFQIIKGIEENTKFTFDDDAFQLLRETIDHFVIEVNDAIREGKVPTKSKTPELVPRMAAALHVFNHSMVQLLAGVPSTPPPTQITKTTLERALAFIQHLESQKDILCQVIFQQNT